VLRQLTEELLSLPGLYWRIRAANTERDRKRERWVSFGPHPQQRALLVLPPSSTQVRRCAVLFIHGGGWRMGSPDFFGFIGHRFAEFGFATIMAGYRLAPQSSYPTQVQDVAVALEEGLIGLAQEGQKPAGIIMAGHSAGAHLAALLALQRDELTGLESTGVQLKGLLVVGGPLDFSCPAGYGLKTAIAQFMGRADNWDEADPARHLDHTPTVPILAVHGLKDPLVDPCNSDSFTRRANEVHPGSATLLVIPDGHHSDLAELVLEDSPDTEFIVSWLEKRARTE